MTAYEATWLEREAQLGALYTGKLSPTIQSRILRMVRALLDRIAPRTSTAPMSPVDALQDLLGQPWLERVMRRLLISVLGYVPAGSLVELSSGAWASVLGPSVTAEALSQPRVRVVSDHHGEPLDRPYDIDLGDAGQNPEKLTIVKVLEDR